MSENSQPMGHWIRVRHVRARAFRLWSLVELALRLVLAAFAVVVFIVALIIAVIVTGGGALLVFGALLKLVFEERQPAEGEELLAAVPNPLMGVWLMDYWQELHVEVVDGQGSVVEHASSRPESQVERDAVLISALERASREGWMVSESLGGSVNGAVETYNGSMPLMLPVMEEPLERLIDRLAAQTVRVSRTDSGVVVSYDEKVAGSKLTGWLRLIGLPVLLVIAVLDWVGGKRPSKWQLITVPWKLVQGHTAVEHTVRIDGGKQPQVSVTSRMGDQIREQQVASGRDVVAVTGAPRLGFDRGVSLEHPTGSILCRTGRLALPNMGPADLRSSVIATVGALMAQEWMSVLSLTESALSCPFCATSYRMTAHQNCPSCGHGAVATLAV